MDIDHWQRNIIWAVKHLIREWVKAYESQGMDGLKRRKTMKKYSVQFKLNTIQFMLNTGASYLETAVQFNLNNPSLIHTLDEGIS